MGNVTARKAQRASGRKAPGGDDPSAIDRHVGARIRERRIMLGISQHELAQRLGVSYQQAHRYEKGQTRISAGALHQLAQIFHVDVSYFYEGVQEEPPGQHKSWQRLFVELARAFERIQDRQGQLMVLELSTFFARASDSSGPPAPQGARERSGTRDRSPPPPRALERQLEPVE